MLFYTAIAIKAYSIHLEFDCSATEILYWTQSMNVKEVFMKKNIFCSMIAIAAILSLSHCKSDENDLDSAAGINYRVSDVENLPPSINMNEGGAPYKYTVVLNSAPSASVTISINLSDNSPDNLEISSRENMASGPSGSIELIFTNTNWNQPQMVSLTLKEDENTNGNQNITITHSSISSQSGYNSLSRALMISTTDNDSPGFTYAREDNSALPNTIRLAEGNTDIDYRYTISLNTPPSADVRLTISLPVETPDNLKLYSGEVIIGAGESTELVFLSGEQAPKTITLTLEADDIDSENVNITIAHFSTSDDSDYNSHSHDIMVSTANNDTAGVATGRNNLFSIDFRITLIEVDTTDIANEYAIKLKTEPLDNVTITIGVSLDAPFNFMIKKENGDDSIGGGESIQLTFTPDNWNSLQKVKLMLMDDNISTGNQDVVITHTLISDDPKYNDQRLRIIVTLQDDEVPTIMTPSTLEVKEGGDSDINISISHQPAQTVVITLTETSNEASIVPGFLVFTPDDWNTPKTSKVSIVDNTESTSSRTFNLSYSATVSNITNPYHGIRIADTTVIIKEDDPICNRSDANSKTDFSGGNYGMGTQILPYIICNAVQLQSMKDDLDAHYELGQDIDASSIADFTPIGNCGIDGTCNNNDDLPFKGFLDGRGFIISDLTVNSSAASGSATVGLFGIIKQANINNIGLLNINISSSSSSSFSSYIGGLVGLNTNSSIITNSWSTGNVSSTSSIDRSFIGGLVGVNLDSRIMNSYFTGNVSSSASDSYAGGLVGSNNDNSTIINSYSTGNVSSSATGVSAAGGLVGSNNNNSTIINSYSTGNVFSTGNEGGLVGNSYQSKITSSYFDKDTSGLTGSVGEARFSIHNCVGGITSNLLKTLTASQNCSPQSIFQDWHADNNDNRYDSNGDGVLDDFVWNFGTNEEYPIIASIPGTADEQAVRMASDLLRFSNTSIGKPSSTDPVFFYDIIDTTMDITISGIGVQGTTAGNYAIEDAVDAVGDALATPPTVTNAGVINGINSLSFGNKFYLSVTFTRGTSPMASYSRRYLFRNNSKCDQPGGTMNNFPMDGTLGTGAMDDPYIICNAMQLQAMRDDLDAHYKLGQNINASSIANFIPIGNCGPDGICRSNNDILNPRSGVSEDNVAFKGSLDGMGFTISNLTINVSRTSSRNSTAGLFGITEGADIRNIGLSNVDISSFSSSSSFVGSLIGYGSSNAHRVSSTITNSWSTGNVSSSGNNSYIGGLVGENSSSSGSSPAGNIINSWFAGNVSSFGINISHAGGLLGRNGSKSKIRNSYSTGNVSTSSSTSIFSGAGGLVGLNKNLDTTIANSWSTGNVFSSGASNVGGLVGRNFRGTIVNSYYNTDTSSQTKSIGENLGATTTCVSGFSASSFIMNTSITGRCKRNSPRIFFNWHARNNDNRYDSDDSGGITSTDAFVWDFGTTSEYPIIASTPGTPDEQAVRMASGFLRFSNTTIRTPSASNPAFLYNIGSGSTSITISGTGVQGTTAGSYAIEDANGNALTTPTVTDTGMINGVSSGPAEFYLSVTFTKGTSPMANYTRRYRFKR